MGKTYTADSFKITEGLSTQSLKADGSLDSTIYTAANTPITANTNTKITYDSKGLIVSGTPLIASDIPNIAQSQVIGLVDALAENPGSGINTAFTIKPYNAVMSVAYNSEQPNFEINLTGNLDLIIIGTVNGDSGIVNLYFSATQIATLQGVTDLVITGAGAMIPVYFIHDTQGIKWYKDEVGGAMIDTSEFALKDGTMLYHTLNQGYTRTITNVGVNCTTDFIPLTAVGWELTKSNGEKAVVATVQNNISFTTTQAFATNSTSVITAVAPSLEVKNDGSIAIYDKGGTKLIAINANGSINLGDRITQNLQQNIEATGFWSFGELIIDSNSSQFEIPSYSKVVWKNGNARDTKLGRFSAGVMQVLNELDVLGDLRLRNLITIPATTYANDAAADADGTLSAGSLYWITGDRVPRKKP